MRIIQALNKNTGKLRFFSDRKSLLEDEEVSSGSSKWKTQIISMALAPNTIRRGFNGWQLSYVDISEDTIRQIVEKDMYKEAVL